VAGRQPLPMHRIPQYRQVDHRRRRNDAELNGRPHERRFNALAPLEIIHMPATAENAWQEIQSAPTKIAAE